MRVIPSTQLALSLTFLVFITFPRAGSFQFRHVILHSTTNAASPLIYRSLSPSPSPSPSLSPSSLTLSSSSLGRRNVKVAFFFLQTDAITDTETNRDMKPKSSTRMAAVEYGRGAEIFPETSDKIIRLEDSFPNGTIPPEVAIALSNGLSTVTLGDESTGDGTYLPSSVSSGSSSTSSTKKGRKRKMVRGAISRILKLAAKSEEQALLESSSSSSSSSANDNYDPFGTAQLLTDRTINKSPSSAIALVLLASGLVPPTQLLCVIFLSGYMTLLVFIASSSKIEGSSGSGSNDND